jgi:O-antigen/teichoic acid export membrane protein
MIGRLRGDALVRRVVENGSWLLAANGLSGGLLALKGLIVARVLGLDGFGVVGVIATFVTVVSRLTSFRMTEFVVQHLSRSEKAGQAEQASIVKYSGGVEALAALIAFAIVWLAAPAGARLVLHDAATTPLIRTFAIVVVTGLVNETATGFLQMYGRFRTCSIATTCGAATTLTGTLLALTFGLTLRNVILAMVAGSVASTLVLVTSALREARHRLGARWWRASSESLAARWRSTSRFLLSTNASATLSLITRDADLLWLGLFRGAADAGLYRLAISLAGLAFMPTAPLSQSIYPEIAREAAGRQWVRFGSVLRRSSTLAAVYVVPVIIIVSAVSGPAIALLYGPQFTAAVPSLLILLVGMGFSNVFFWSRPALLALHRPDFPLKVNLGLAVLKVVAIFAVIPVYGHVGVAAVLAASYLVGVALCVWKARQIVMREQHVLAPV